MAELSTSYPDLSILFDRMPGFAALQAGEMSRNAGQNMQSLQDAFAAEQSQKALERPYDLQQKQATVRGTNATAGYNEALAAHRGLGNRKEEATFDSDVAAAKSKNKTQIGTDEITQMEQFGDAARMAGAKVASAVTPWDKMKAIKDSMGSHIKWTPESEKFFMDHIQNAHQYLSDMGNNIFETTKAAKMEKMKEEAAQKRVETQTGSAERINAANIEAGKYKGKGGGGGKSPEEMLSKMGYEKASVYYDAKAEAAREIGDEKAATHYAEQADKMKSAYERAKILAAQAAAGGKLDLPAIANKQATPTPQPQGFSQPAAPAAKPQANLQDVMKMYPGIPPEKLKEAYKKKFGVDLQ